ncbi:aspartate-semialdehyde dehydrogenase [Bdellovibrionota bacterium FG-2]
MKKKLKVAVVGATGAVGRILLSILEERRFPLTELVPFASSRSLGKIVTYQDKPLTCQVLALGCFQDVDLAFFDASDAVSKQWVPVAQAAGTWVVDNSATFRYDPSIPLMVPELNAESLSLALASGSKVITGPNCSTVQMVMALKPIQDLWGLKRVVVSTYQSTSGAGAAAMQELQDQTAEFLGAPARHSANEPSIFPHPIAFNCIPHIGGFASEPGSPFEGYSSEERKMILETRKILGLPELAITATAVRVPTLACHGESINIETLKPFELHEVRSALKAQTGITLVDDPLQKQYPLGRNGAGKDAVFVGRLRRDSSIENALNLWVVSDNLRKGAALNAVQIGELLVQCFFT